MSTIKDEVIRLIKGMPDSATIEEIIDALDYKKLVDRRLMETREAESASESPEMVEPAKAPRAKGKRR